MTYGYSLPLRLQTFNELFSNRQLNQISKYDVRTGTGSDLHDVFNVPIGLPKYRLDNTRTLAMQDEYIYKEGKKEDFFNDIESDEVQFAQHSILCKLIRSSDKDKDLLNYFLKNTQTDPFILTHDGFVISGNRRLCALRELVLEYPEKCKHFNLVRVVILPLYESDKIEQIEDFLEQQKDIKDPFSWISRGIGYRRRMKKNNISDEKLSEITGLKKNEINSLINKVEIADRYLQSIDRPKEYNYILDDEFAFETIYSCQSKDRVSTPLRKLAFEKLSFLAIKNKNSFPDRMYKNISTLFNAQPLIHNELLNEFENEILDIESQKKTISPIAGLQMFSDPTESLLILMGDKKNENKIVDIVADKIIEYQTLERDKKEIYCFR